MTNTSQISVQDFSVSYGNKKVLENLDLDIKPGEFVAIVGKSGTGKTTLLNALAGFVRHQGNLNISGRIGFCFQNNSLFYWMTIGENIAFGLNGLSRAEKNTIVDETLSAIDLIEYKNKYPKELSGGQQQRVALCRALVSKPEILLLDEPFSSLDIYTRDQMIVWVSGIISKTNITVLMVTHYLDEAIILADRIVILKNKSILTELNVPLSKPASQEIRYTEPFQNLKQELTLLLNSK